MPEIQPLNEVAQKLRSDLFFPTEELPKLMEKLKMEYQNVFPKKHLDRHIKEFIGFEASFYYMGQIEPHLNQDSKILDVGCGYGSFTSTSLSMGYDTKGIEFQEFEYEFAKKRIKTLFPEKNPEEIIFRGSALELPFENESFDCVCFWNSLEHIPNYKEALKEAKRVLKPGGFIYIICPNYAAFRKEAHYHVWLPPLMPKNIFGNVLKAMGKDPDYFMNDIHYRTNLGVLKALKDTGFQLVNPYITKLENPKAVRSEKTRKVIDLLKTTKADVAAKAFFNVWFYHPGKHSVVVQGIKA